MGEELVLDRKRPGRAPGGLSLTKELKKLLGEMGPAELTKGEEKTYAQLIVKVWALKAMKGSFPHLKEILDRTEGKVPDRVAGADGGPIGIDVIVQGIDRIYGVEAAREVEAQLVGVDGDLLPLPSPEEEE